MPSIFIRFPPNWRRKQAAIQSHQWDTPANLNPTGVLTYLALKCTQRNDNRMMVFSFGCLLYCTGPTFRFAGLHPEFEAPFCASKPDGSDLEVSGIVHVLWVNFRDSVPDATVKKMSSCFDSNLNKYGYSGTNANTLLHRQSLQHLHRQ